MTVVAKPEPSAFQRTFPAKELFRGNSVRGWSGLPWVRSACACCCSCWGYLGDLLITQGEVTIDGDDAQSHAALVRILTGDASPDGAEDRPASAAACRVLLVTRVPFGPGIDTDSPAAARTGGDHHWRREFCPRSGATATLSGSSPRPEALRSVSGPAESTARHLGVLVGLGALLAWCAACVHSQARQHWNAAALDVSTRLRKSIHRQALRLGPADLEGGSNRQSLELFTSAVDNVREGVLAWLGCHGRDLTGWRCWPSACCWSIPSSPWSASCRCWPAGGSSTGRNSGPTTSPG